MNLRDPSLFREHNYVAGKWVNGTGLIPVTNPANGQVIGNVPSLGRSEAASSIDAAAEFGLACYLYTRDLGRTWRVGEALEYGVVGTNTGIISTEVAPFGGVKQNGIGREGSRHGLYEDLEYKYMLMSGLGCT